MKCEIKKKNCLCKGWATFLRIFSIILKKSLKIAKKKVAMMEIYFITFFLYFINFLKLFEKTYKFPLY